MIMRIARRALSGFVAWRHRRRVKRALPQIQELERLLNEHRSKHRPVRPLLRAQREIIRNQLAREQGKRLSERTYP